MFERMAWRVQPYKQYRKRKQRKREMWARHEAFLIFLQEEVLKPMMRRARNEHERTF